MRSSSVQDKWSGKLHDHIASIQTSLIRRAADPANWIAWPAAMIPMALIGMVLATRIWNAKPKSSAGGH